MLIFFMEESGGSQGKVNKSEYGAMTATAAISVGRPADGDESAAVLPCFCWRFFVCVRSLPLSPVITLWPASIALPDLQRVLFRCFNSSFQRTRGASCSSSSRNKKRLCQCFSVGLC